MIIVQALKTTGRIHLCDTAVIVPTQTYLYVTIVLGPSLTSDVCNRKCAHLIAHITLNSSSLNSGNVGKQRIYCRLLQYFRLYFPVLVCSL